MYDLTWIDWMLAAALIAMLAVLAATVVHVIRTTEPADDGPLLADVDDQGDATPILPPTAVDPCTACPDHGNCVTTTRPHGCGICVAHQLQGRDCRLCRSQPAVMPLPVDMPELDAYRRAVDDLDTDEIPPPPVDPAPEYQRTLSPHWQALVDPQRIDPDIPVLVAHPTDGYLGRHSTESIEMRLPVEPGWRPPVGRHRIAAAVDGTQQMPAVRA